MKLGKWVAIALGVIAALIVGKISWGLLNADAPEAPLTAITLESKPPGAEIWLDGFPLGKVTPTTLKIDNGLPHQLELRLAGWMKARKTIPAGEPEGTLAVELRQAGKISISSDPPGATVVIADEEVGTTPCTVEVGVESPARVLVTLDGFLPETSEISVASGESVPWAVRLRPAGKLNISSDPPGVVVSVDGKPVGHTPRSVSVEAGAPHLVQILLGKLQASQVATVAAGATREVRLRIDDTNDQQLQVSLQMTVQRIERLRGRIARISTRHPNQIGDALARTHQQEKLEEEVERLEQRQQAIEGTIASHRTELEDRTQTRPARR